jgi:arylsulfatase
LVAGQFLGCITLLQLNFYADCGVRDNESTSCLMPSKAKHAPNVLFIMPDQLRPDFLGFAGCTGIPTPHLDALALESTVYGNAFSPSPLCVPARAALLTGRAPLSNGVLTNHHWLRPEREELGMKTWPDLLRDRGYRTAAVGKMHFHPFDAMEGFDERCIAEDKRWTLIQDDYAEFLAVHGLRKFDPRGLDEYRDKMGAVTFPHGRKFSPDRFVADAAIEFLARQPQGRPFALMVGFPGPHCPYDPCPESLDRVDASRLPKIVAALPDQSPGRDAWFRAYVEGHKRPWHQLDYTSFPGELREMVRHHYAALVAEIDEEVGRIIDACKERGEWDNTLVIFTSDHGEHAGDRGLVGKGDFFEESIRIPMIVKYPGQHDSQQVATPVQLQQSATTILSEAGADIPEYWEYRALNESNTEEKIFGVLGDSCMVRSGKWKLIHYQAGFQDLFDLDNDPREQTNLALKPGLQALRAGLESELLHYVLRGALAGHAEKLVSSGQPLAESTKFARRGWTRTYPMPL